MTTDPIPTPHAINGHASSLMVRGITLLGAGGRAAAPQALACFDAALALRRGLPIDEVPQYRYGLAACFLNRAEALLVIGTEDSVTAAVGECDTAITLLTTMPAGTTVRFERRLAVAYQNRGVALHALGRFDAAAHAFMDALTTIAAVDGEQLADRSRLAAAIWANLANARAAEGTLEADAHAAEASRRAMALVASIEPSDLESAEIGLKARHVLCRTVARRLGLADSPEAIHEGTDLADEGLALIEHWERAGVARFRDLGLDLFRFGAGLYARFQPQFLDEFFAERLDPARSSPEYVSRPELQAIAAQVSAGRSVRFRLRQGYGGSPSL